MQNKTILSNNAFEVFAEEGKGQSVYFSPLLLTESIVPNTCLSLSCTFSVALVESQIMRFRLSIYINGVAVITDLRSDLPYEIISKNFEISQGDVLQLVPTFEYTAH